MNAVIKLRPEELDYNLLQKIKELVNGKNDIEVRISLSDDKSQYFKTLDTSIADLKAGEYYFFYYGRVSWIPFKVFVMRYARFTPTLTIEYNEGLPYIKEHLKK